MMFNCEICKKSTRHHWDEYFNRFICNQSYKHNPEFMKTAKKIIRKSK